jgi:CheY-like chemotaxis protein
MVGCPDNFSGLMSGPGRILIIDDNEEFAENIKEILEDEDLHAQVANDGPSGLSALAENEFDLVITDMKMPGMNGLEVIRFIKEKWPALPVIVISAYARDELLEQAEKEGALGILSKPVDMEYLTRFVNKVANSDNKILIVEDDDDMRSNLSSVVSDIDSIVPLTAPSQAEADRMSDNAQLKGAIIDLRLPDGDGVELGKRLRDKFGNDLPVVFITGFAADFRENLEQVLGLDGVNLLEKPFAIDKFVALVEAAMSSDRRESD